MTAGRPVICAKPPAAAGERRDLIIVTGRGTETVHQAGTQVSAQVGRAGGIDLSELAAGRRPADLDAQRPGGGLGEAPRDR